RRGHAEQLRLELCGVRHDGAAEHPARPRDLDERGREQPAGQRLGDREGLPALQQGVEDGAGLVVHATGSSAWGTTAGAPAGAAKGTPPTAREARRMRTARTT